MIDIEQALQDAAADVLGTGEVSTLEDGNVGIDRAVEMMLAHPSMQAIARVVEAAVAEVESGGGLNAFMALEEAVGALRDDRGIDPDLHQCGAECSRA